MGLSVTPDPRVLWRNRRRWTVEFSFGAIALCSLGGALIFPISDLGRTGLASISREWALELGIFWLGFVIWALLYGALLRGAHGLSAERAMQLSAISLTPLLLCISLVAAIYSNDQANHAYLVGPYKAVFQGLGKIYVFAGVASVQLVILAALRGWSFAGALPILSVAVLALCLRVWNLGWSLPALLHIDEHRYVGGALTMLGSGDLNPHHFENPSLLIYLDYVLVRLLSPHVQTFHAAAEFLGSPFLDPRGDLVVDLAARGLSAGTGVLTVVVVYLAAKELFGTSTGIVAGLVFSVSLLHVRNSHFATNDVVATFLMTCAFSFAVGLYSRGTGRYYLLAGLFAGLATSAKYNMGVVVVSILAAHLLRARNAEGAGAQKTVHLKLVLAAAASLVGFVAGTPYSILDFPSFVNGFRIQYDYGDDLWRGQEATAPFLMYASTLAYGFGAIPLALSVAGAVLSLRRSLAGILLVLSVPAAYLMFMTSEQLFFARFAIPLLPFLAVLAGRGAVELYRLVPGKRCRSLAAVAILVVATIQPVAQTLQFEALMARADTRTLAAAWVDANIPSDARIAIEGYSQMDGRYGWPTGIIRSTWTFRAGNEEDLRVLLSGEFDYVLVSSFGYGTWFDAGGDKKLDPEWYRRLTEGASLLASFSPGPREPQYNLDDTYAPFWNLGSRERPGPTVRIYRLGAVGR